MTGLSVSLTSMSAVARGIAEADRVGMAANAQAATPIRNRRFIFTVSLEPHHRGEETMHVEPESSPFKSVSADFN
jgi:hypothetical protein